jgi:small subunit ribosomal protein S1
VVSKNSSKTSASKEPQTMDELLLQYGGSFHTFSVGDTVKGKVIRIEPGRLIVDIGGKSEGLVAEKTYKEAEKLIGSLKVGDEIQARVIVSETPEGYTILSLRNAVEDIVWKKIRESHENGLPISVKGKSVAASGIAVEIENLTGFIPGSQLGKTVAKNPQGLVGKHFQAVVIDFDRQNRKVVLSEKEVTEKEELAESREAIKNVKVGDEFEAVVLSVYDFGCFVKVNVLVGKKSVTLEGLVHISELSWEKTESVTEVVSEGDKLSVKVIGKQRDKLAFSVKQAGKDPWEKASEKYEVDMRLKGKVVKVSDFGMFVQLEPGIEGLVHITKIPPDKKFARGDEVNVYIEEVDKETRKISLGLVLTEKPIGYK